jgi:hypothetical protein
MSTQIEIQTIESGVEPYTIYVCDINETNCIYIPDQINNSQLPYTFEVPTGYQNSNFLVKILDFNGCKILKIFS